MLACICIQSNKLLILDFKSFKSPNRILAFVPESIIGPFMQSLFGFSDGLPRTRNLLKSDNSAACNVISVFSLHSLLERINKQLLLVDKMACEEE